jgi:uncharacterized lipoprotein YajG
MAGPLSWVLFFFPRLVACKALLACAHSPPAIPPGIDPLKKMKSQTGILAFTSLTLLAVILLSGCTTYVPLTYTPQAGVKPVAGAGAVAVSVVVNDARTEKDRIGAVSSGSTETSSILTTNDVPAFVKSVIETELADRGFSLGGSKVQVVAELSVFDSYFSVEGGIISGGYASGHVTMDVQVKRADGSKVYEKHVAGECSASDVSYSGANKTRYGLDMALQDAMTKLFEDGSFVEALLKAAQP